MIKNLINFFIIFIFSPEFVILILAMLIALFANISDDWVQKNITINSEAIKYLSFIPIGIGSWVLNSSRKLLFPREEFHSYLREWNGYTELKITVFVAVIYAFLFILLGLSSWVFGLQINTFHSLVFLFTPVIGSIVLALTIYLAGINQEEIIAKIKKL